MQVSETIQQQLQITFEVLSPLMATCPDQLIPDSKRNVFLKTQQGGFFAFHDFFIRMSSARTISEKLARKHVGGLSS